VVTLATVIAVSAHPESLPSLYILRLRIANGISLCFCERWSITGLSL